MSADIPIQTITENNDPSTSSNLSLSNGNPALGSLSSQNDEEGILEWKFAREGIALIINDKYAEADKLFKSYPDSLVMFSGYAFSLMVDALTSFEDEKLNIALNTLKEVEKKCTVDSGWFKAVAQRVFGRYPDNPVKPYAEQLETQIILADSQVCIAILTFLQQDFTGYIKGSWVLRKAWKIYQKLYKEILELYKQNVGELEMNYLTNLSVIKEESSGNLLPSLKSNERAIKSNEAAISRKESKTESTSNGKQMDKDVISRLMAAVSFGYGLFQLGISLLPPSLIRVINLFGFTNDRENGIACLMYARKGTDMRAPLATLCLLWYHTIVRPFYAIDGTNVNAGVETSFMLIKESQGEFGNSSLFLFFKGRANRLTSNIKEALTCFQQAAKNSEQREMKMLCQHEIGWCHLIELEYNFALDTFSNLRSTSRWSKVFYCYVALICAGSCGDFSNPSLFEDLKKMTFSMPKGAQLDEFLNRRCKYCPSELKIVMEKKRTYWKLLIFEMLYLWNALPSCSTENIIRIVEECQTVTTELDEPMVGLAQLILGCCYAIQKRYAQSIPCFRKCLELRQHIPTNAKDAHISAFCQYELASILIKNHETKEEGRLLLEQMGQYTQYDFEQKLNVRVHSCLKQC